MNLVVGISIFYVVAWVGLTILVLAKAWRESGVGDDTEVLIVSVLALLLMSLWPLLLVGKIIGRLAKSIAFGGRQ